MLVCSTRAGSVIGFTLLYLFLIFARSFQVKKNEQIVKICFFHIEGESFLFRKMVTVLLLYYVILLTRCPSLKSPGTSSSCDRRPDRVSVKDFRLCPLLISDYRLSSVAKASSVLTLLSETGY